MPELRFLLPRCISTDSLPPLFGFPVQYVIPELVANESKEIVWLIMDVAWPRWSGFATPTCPDIFINETIDKGKKTARTRTTITSINQPVLSGTCIWACKEVFVSRGVSGEADNV